MIRCLSLFALLFVIQTLNAQSFNKPDINTLEQAFKEVLKNSEYSDISIDKLNSKNKNDILFHLINNSSYADDSWFIAFNWLIKNGADLNQKNPKNNKTHLEEALYNWSKPAITLLVQNGAKIPKLIIDPRCKENNMPPLARAIDMNDLDIAYLLLEHGVKADSLSLRVAVEELYPNEFVRLFPYDIDTSLQINNKGIIDNIYNNFYSERWNRRYRRDKVWFNIKPIHEYEKNCYKLLEAIFHNDNAEIGKLTKPVLDFYDSYKRNLKKENEEEKFDEIMAFAVAAACKNNTRLLDLLYKRSPMQVALVFTAWLNYVKETQEWAIKNRVIELIDNQDEFTPYSNSKAFLKNPILLKNYILNDKSIENVEEKEIVELLACGADKELIQLLYKNLNFKDSKTFNMVLDADIPAINKYLEDNGNPFVKDCFGITLFDYMMCYGLEEPVLKIFEENKYLPIGETGACLAFIGKNNKIIDGLCKKINVKEHGKMLYTLAIIRNDKEMIQQLIMAKVPANENIESFTNLAFYLFRKNDIQILSSLIEAGMSVDEIIEGRDFLLEKIRPNDFLSHSLNGSLLAHAIVNKNFEAVKLLVNKGANPELKVEDEHIGLIFIAAAANTPEIAEYLVSKGANVNDKIKRHTPLRIAVELGCTENISKLIEMGAKFQPLLPGDDPTQRKALIDIAPDLATRKILTDKGYPDCKFIDEILEFEIRYRLNDKAFDLIHRFDSLLMIDPLQEALNRGNNLFAQEYIANQKINPEEYIEAALLNQQKWFFDYCFANEEYSSILKNFTDSEGNTLLHMALKDGDYPRDYSMLKYFLMQGLDPNKKNNEGATPFFLVNETSAFEGKQELLDLMKSKGANADYSPDLINLSMSEAIKAGNFDKVKQMLEMGANPNLMMIENAGYYSQNIDSIPALSFCISKYDYNTAQLLLLFGANPNCKYPNDQTPLSACFTSDFPDLPRLLIYMGADVNFKPKNDYNPVCEEDASLLQTIKMSVPKILPPEEYTELTSFTLDSMLLNAIRKENESQLSRIFSFLQENYGYYSKDLFAEELIRNCSVSFISRVFDKYLDVDQKKTWLYYEALNNNRLDVIDLLEDKGLAIKDSVRYDDFLMDLIRKGSRPFSFNTLVGSTGLTDGHTWTEPVRFATDKDRENYLKIAKKILSKHKNIDTKAYITKAYLGNFHEMALMLMNYIKIDNNLKLAFNSIAQGNDAQLNKLLSDGLNVNQDIGKVTLLSWACMLNNTSAVELLLEKGANAKIEEFIKPDYYDNGFYPENWAVINGNIKIVDLLNSKGAKNYYLNTDINLDAVSTCFDILIWKENKEALKYFLDKKYFHLADGNDNVRNALSNAILKDDPEIMELLLQYPPDKQFFDEYKGIHYYAPFDKKTALKYAIKEGATKCFEHLSSNFELLKEIFKDPYLLSEAPNAKINKWILNNGYTIDKPNQLEQIIKEAIYVGNTDYLKLIFEKTPPTVLEELVKETNSREITSVKDSYTSIENIEILKILIDKNLIDDKTIILQEAVMKGRKEIISYLINNGTSLINSKYYEKLFIPDLAKDYETWKFTIDEILKTIKK